MVYGTYSDKDRSHIMGTAESTIYLAYHRTGWALAVCWIVFACATGHGGTEPINVFLQRGMGWG